MLDVARRVLVAAAPLACEAGLEVLGYKNRLLGRILLVSVVPIAALVSIPGMKRLVDALGLGRQRGSIFAFSTTILVLGLTLAAWRILEPRRPCPRADNGQRTEYVYPASYSGDVYV